MVPVLHLKLSDLSILILLINLIIVYWRSVGIFWNQRARIYKEGEIWNFSARNRCWTLFQYWVTSNCFKLFRRMVQVSLINQFSINYFHPLFINVVLVATISVKSHNLLLKTIISNIKFSSPINRNIWTFNKIVGILILSLTILFYLYVQGF